MMQTFIEWGGKKFVVDLLQPIDISIPLNSGAENPNAFGIQQPIFEPFKAGGFVGSVQLGGSVNCENLFINAHGNGTHTECVGHISKERITINQSLKTFFFIAQLISVTPNAQNLVEADAVASQLLPAIDALIIRTLPNGSDKKTRNYSGNNPAALEPALGELMAKKEITHVLVDLPSVDPEHDNGLLSTHHAFWNYPNKPRLNATITEMIFVEPSIEDGLYLLNIQIAPIESDASPSKPILYKLKHVL